jgi:hypothetical protein
VKQWKLTDDQRVANRHRRAGTGALGLLPLLAVCSLGLLAHTRVSAAPRSFYMDEGTHYSDIGMCKNEDLNTVTESLASEMRSNGWTGSRFVNELAWPQDFRDKSLDPNGLDNQFGDNATVTVFAGHGNAGLLTFRPRLNTCSASAGSNMSLGSGSTGGLATIGIWLSCDMLASGLLDEANSSYRRMNLRQSLGWLNTISIDDDEARDFFRKSERMSNKDAWLDQMQGDGRQPIVLTATTATDASTCWFFHGRESLGQGVADSLGGSWGYRCWEWIEYD